jgi:hypothetical protein
MESFVKRFTPNYQESLEEMNLVQMNQMRFFRAYVHELNA